MNLYTNRSDNELIEAFRDGENKAFEALLVRYKDRLYSYIYSLVRDEQQADDAFQDTFVKIIRYIKTGKYNHQNKFLAFAMRIAKNLIGDQWRKDMRYPLVMLTQEEYNTLQIKNSYTVEDDIIKDQTHTQLKKMISKLPAAQYEVLRLRYYDDLSYAEIAEITNTSINTALGRMRYALINLRKMAEVEGLALV